MTSKKIKQKQLLEQQIIEDKKFNKFLLIGFSVVLLVVVLVLVFVTFWCDTKYAYRKYALYNKEVPNELVCMCDNSLQYHESSIVVMEGKTFFICAACKRHITNHFREVAYTTDVFSGDTICKANALIGLKERGKPNVVYFKNRQSFNKYYKTRKIDQVSSK